MGISFHGYPHSYIKDDIMKTENLLMRKTYSYKYLMPGLIIFVFLVILPAVGSFYYSVFNYNGLKVGEFVGLNNFKEIFTNSNVNICFKNTFIFSAVTLFLKVVLGLAFALLANTQIRTKGLFKSILFFPVILSSVAVGVSFTAILHPETGIVNIILRTVGLGALAHEWLTDPGIVMYSIAAVDVWKNVGFHMALFLAGLQIIPHDLYESAFIDGAGSVKKFIHITVPLLLPVINTNILFSIIGGMKVFDSVYVLTGGGPGNASQVINTIVLSNFAQMRYGEATAANVILFVMVMITILVLNKFLGMVEKEV